MKHASIQFLPFLYLPYAPPCKGVQRRGMEEGGGIVNQSMNTDCHGKAP